MQYRNILCEFGHNLMAFSYAHPPGGALSLTCIPHVRPKIAGRGVFFMHKLRDPRGLNRDIIVRQDEKGPPKASNF